MSERATIDDAPASTPDVIDDVRGLALVAPGLARDVPPLGGSHRPCAHCVARRTASGAGDRAAVLVYGLGVTAMLATSGLYHHARLAHRERRMLRRLDHSMILVSISGTYTAVIVLALEGAERVVLLSLRGHSPSWAW